MKIPGKIAPWAVLGFAALVLVAVVMPTYRQGEPSIARKSAENFDITLGGKSAHLSDLKGKVVVLNFWASYCGSCVEEIPPWIASSSESSRAAVWYWALA